MIQSAIEIAISLTIIFLDLRILQPSLGPEQSSSPIKPLFKAVQYLKPYIPPILRPSYLLYIILIHRGGVQFNVNNNNVTQLYISYDRKAYIPIYIALQLEGKGYKKRVTKLYLLLWKKRIRLYNLVQREGTGY